MTNKSVGACVGNGRRDDKEKEKEKEKEKGKGNEKERENEGEYAIVARRCSQMKW